MTPNPRLHNYPLLGSRSIVQPTYEVTDAPGYEHPHVPSPVPPRDDEPRCWRCKKKLAVYLSRPWELVCVRCGATNASSPD